MSWSDPQLQKPSKQNSKKVSKQRKSINAMKSQKNFKTADVGLKAEDRITNRQNADLLGNKLVKRSQPKMAKGCMNNEVDKRMFTNLEKELDDYVEKKSMKNHKGNSSAANRYKAADGPEPKMAK